MSPKRNLLHGLLCRLLVLLLAIGTGVAGAAVGVQANPMPASPLAPGNTPESSDLPLTAGSFQVAPVHILGVPVLTVASPEVAKGAHVVTAQQRARVIEGNLARLYAPQQLCSRGEALAETFLDVGFLRSGDVACQSDASAMANASEAIEIRVRGSAPGPIELVAMVQGRQEPWPLLTVTSEDAVWNGTSQAALAKRWQQRLERRLRYARSLLHPHQLAERAKRVLAMEAVLLVTLLLCLGLWRRSRRSMRQLDRNPPAVLADRPRLRGLVSHGVQNISRALLLLAALLIVLSIGVAELAVPGQLPVALDLLLQPGGLLLKLIALWGLTALSRAVLAMLLSQWAGNIDVPDERRARRTQRYRSLQRVLGRLVDLVAILLGVVWILSDIPGVQELSTAAVVAGGALLGALAIVFQGLLRDFVAGLVVIFDDRYAIGDNVDIHGFSGTVTDVGLLSTELRCVDQRVVVLQNSSFDQVVNHTKLRSGFDLRVPLSPGLTQLEPALQVIRQVCERFAENPQWAAGLLEPPVLRGIDEITPQQIVVSVLLTTAAGEQWRLKRSLLQQLLSALQQAGIPLANQDRSGYVS
jgi:small conductance mechanosensitive channel